MTRIASDLYKIGSYIWNSSPDSAQKFYISIAATLATATVAAGSSAGYKFVRWISRDPTQYVAWNDLSGQLNRLATDRFSDIKGALAPAAIYDRRSIKGIDSVINLISAVAYLANKGKYVLGTAAALGLALRSLQECHQFGDQSDPQLSERCWDHLGSLIQEPTMLPLLATTYTLSKGTMIALILGTATAGLGILLTSSMANGFESSWLPVAFRTKGILLEERYRALTLELIKQWKEVENQDTTKKDDIIKLAKQLNQRSQLISLSLEENLNLSEKESEKITLLLIKSAQTIIKQQTNK